MTDIETGETTTFIQLAPYGVRFLLKK